MTTIFDAEQVDIERMGGRIKITVRCHTHEDTFVICPKDGRMFFVKDQTIRTMDKSRYVPEVVE